MIPQNEETNALRLQVADIINKLPQSVPHRIGNWTEESVLREEQLKDFLQKYERGVSSVAQNERRLRIARREEFLSGMCAYSAPLMLRNLHSDTLLALDVPPSFPDNVNEKDLYSMTTADEQRPVARCCWRMVPYDHGRHGNSGGLVYGAKVYIIMTGVLEQPMFLASDIKSFATIAKLSKHQAAYTTFERDYRSVWQIEYADPGMRPEMEGADLQANTPIILRHCKTGSCLSSDTAFTVRNDFGMEHEVACHTYKDHGSRVELDQNRWLVVVSDKE
ncbi:hypothetical protein DFJ77DRAFT_547948 [Powellomyces hirtus]|nr:hypothetical protein DFJ77DRAFT_547948 [Powellomyces hirtus]